MVLSLKRSKRRLYRQAVHSPTVVAHQGLKEGHLEFFYLAAVTTTSALFLIECNKILLQSLQHTATTGQDI
jgi:hypothetical protein